MLKSTRGSVTMMAYAAMLFFALYCVILYSNAVRQYKLQTNEANMIQEAYTSSAYNNLEELTKIYYDNGGKT